MNPRHTEALRLAELGYSVFPCDERKRPLTEHGCLDATADADQIDAWWESWPSANLAVETGRLVVLDVDPGGSTWLTPEREVDLAGAPQATTPRGGRHFYLRAPPGSGYRNTAGKLAPGIDTRAQGGYVVAPPSYVRDPKKSIDGGYAWVSGLALDVPPERLPLPPTWLCAMLDGAGKPQASAGDGNGSSPDGAIPEGQRNAHLTSLAGSMRRRGMRGEEILAALRAVNRGRCRPPLDDREVEGIADSVSRYAPTELPEDSRPEGPVTLRLLAERHPTLAPPVIDGLLRHGETMNLIAPPKVGKSWLAHGLAISVATGRHWLNTFAAAQGQVLLIDNELHAATIANRLRRVAEAMGVSFEDVAEMVHVVPLRGRLVDVNGLGPIIRALDRGAYRLIILDAMYRALPGDAEENSNSVVRDFFNRVDQYAGHTGSGWTLIHHASKGGQAGKAQTDVGAGAGAQSRAADCHATLRQHLEPGCYVLEASPRSYPPAEARVLRWTFPTWQPATGLDPADLWRPPTGRRARPAAAENEAEPVPWTPKRFAETYLKAEPIDQKTVEARARADGLPVLKVKDLIALAIADRFAFRWSYPGDRAVYLATVEQPLTATALRDSDSHTHTAPHTPRSGKAARGRGRRRE